MDVVETDDIFRGASLLCMGARLRGIYSTDHQPRAAAKHVHFRLEGDSIKACDMEYRLGKCLVNPLQLREALNLLRDLIFKGDRKAS